MFRFQAIRSSFIIKIDWFIFDETFKSIKLYVL